MNSSIIKIQNVCYSIVDESGYRKSIVNNISFDVEYSKITTLLGNKNSGSGVLTKIIAGLIKPEFGNVISEKKIVFIPSEPSSFPWIDVEKNILYNLKDYEKSKFRKIITLVGLNGYENHLPNNKSFGFRFRISVARALMNDVEILVLEEPFALMDSLTKRECTNLLQKINSEEKLTILFTCSNILDAVNLSQNILIISNDADKPIKEFVVDNTSKFELRIKLEEILNR